ncbi:MAG: hypothetical protein LH468_04080 [Nocardioides sp.]|nr:hypothetical protein [Nocardioides sp.]
MSAVVAFALASMLHAGFQVTVTALVYPALAAVEPARWTRAHALHSRRIVGLVVLVYAALLGTGVALVVSGPPLAGWLGLAGAAGALVVTATLAAPAHGRLQAPDPDLLRRLLRVDRLRRTCAVLGAIAAVVAVAQP